MIGMTEIRAGAWKYACIAAAIAAVVLLAILLAAVRSAASADRRADAATSKAESLSAALDAANGVIAEERRQVKEANRISEIYEQDKNDAQDRSEKLAADLRAGAVKLRQPWRCESPAMPEAAASPGESDAAERSRQDSASRIVGAADKCDAQVKALQDLLKAERE